MSFGWNVDKTSTYSALDHSNQVIPLTRAEKVKDLGVYTDTRSCLMKIYLLNLKTMCMIKLIYHT